MVLTMCVLIGASTGCSNKTKTTSRKATFEGPNKKVEVELKKTEKEKD